MAKFNMPKEEPVYKIKIENFNGIDLRNAESKVSPNRSPMCPNMIRETKGNNRKRHGYETLKTFDGSINGVHILKDKILIHAGSKYYLDGQTPTVLYSTGNDHISVSKQVNGKLYINDGKNYLGFDGTTLKKVSENAKVPKILITRKYNGGGVPLEPINLLTPYKTEGFIGDATATTYQLSVTNLDAAEMKIKSAKSDGTWADLKENVDFTVNRTLGTYSLNSAKPVIVVGEDNLLVTYAKTISGYAEKIEKCDISILYGASGQRDRLFVSGNPDFPHYDWYSQANDPTYFGDTWYSVIGQDSAEIMGYSIINDMLVTHKNTAENDSNANIRKGELLDEKVVFKSNGSFNASGALGKYTFASFDNEPLYLTTDKNISAITPSDVLGERFSQERSYYISSALSKESNLDSAFAIIYHGFYMLAVNDKIYILDSTQPVFEQDTPYSNRQYECYLFTNIGARVLWKYEDRLYFGTSEGKIKRFLNKDVGGFTDDGVVTEKTILVDGIPITTKESFPCYWDTHEIYGEAEELKKTFKHLATLLASHSHTGCRVWAKIEGIWVLIFDYDESADYFDFKDIDFRRFTFRTDHTPTVIGGKFKARNVLHIQFRFENSRPEPFGIYFAIIKYTMQGEYIK